MSLCKERVDSLKAHFVIECSDNEFPDRDGAAMRKERFDSKVAVDAFDLRRIEGCIRPSRYPAKIHALGN